jgi:SanA protein
MLYNMKRFLLYSALVLEIAIIFVLAINVFIRLETRPYIYESVAEAPNAEVVVIPGAAIFPSGALSSIFLDRADMAIRLYDAKKVSKILVSGDNSTVSHNEVNPVRNYLLLKGVPDQDIFLDHAGFDTYSTMYRARDIFGVTSMLIATQSFHLPRAVFIARALGINAYGVNADNGPSLFRNYFREVFADEKTVFDLVFHIKPEYLGNRIPIVGDGRDYP